jgi:hypothetical protein
MNHRLIGWLTAGALLVGFLVSASVAVAANVDDDEPLTGTTLEQASDAALAETGGGTVLETERGDDGAAYSVEVQTPDGAIVEVNLDEKFAVIDTATDEDTPGESETTDDD